GGAFLYPSAYSYRGVSIYAMMAPPTLTRLPGEDSDAHHWNSPDYPGRSRPVCWVRDGHERSNSRRDARNQSATSRATAKYRADKRRVVHRGHHSLRCIGERAIFGSAIST